MKHHRYLIACVLPLLFPLSIWAEDNAQHYLAKGNEFLTTGQFNDAVINFDAAISRDPDNYLSYFKRAMAYLSMGRNNAAVDDFSKILTLKPDFDKALLQRARIYAKEGQFQLAKTDLQKYLKSSAKDANAKALLESVEKAESSLTLAEKKRSLGEYDECIELVSSVVQTSPQLARVRLLAAQCHIAKGAIDEAAGDLARAAHLTPSDPQLLTRLAKINYFSLYEPQGALSHVKQCLHYDPEQKECKKLFRLIKKLEKELTTIRNDYSSKKYATAANKLIGTSSKRGLIADADEQMQSLEKELDAVQKMPKNLHVQIYELACKIFGEQKSKDAGKVEKWCSAVLSLNENNVDALIYRGEVKLEANEFEAAVKDLHQANEVSEGRNHRVRQLLQRAQQMLKQSKRRDYYKILDVSRNADTREIKKAYRKKAHEWHPDKYSGEMNREQVEQKMAEINQAYEVLSNDDLRQQYDNGFDPYDPENGQRGGGGGPGGHPFHGQNPFAHFQGGFPFGGGFPGGNGQPFSFKMQF
ncbi:uncharacterized protein BYT42DRAFT_497317 [Radiomyces spectabilis]|uniref:uncharacterized protein n=1 Tax=Radiomyces spectabilis TaxID=64574 RepID=UPI0022203626|nr:uncharacterized protein BYT42DRAFT_497317 [Radiomyces spectabilis]KAI8378041.1 hypothetical protein BYT42DRAFT_497317 [Radiomyces spectabilis]